MLACRESVLIDQRPDEPAADVVDGEADRTLASALELDLDRPAEGVGNILEKESRRLSGRIADGRLAQASGNGEARTGPMSLRPRGEPGSCSHSAERIRSATRRREAG